MLALVPGMLAFSQSDRTRISLEIDPATYVFGGYSAHLRVQPRGREHLLLGLGAYAMNTPKPLVDINPENRDEGWEVRIQNGLGFFTEYYFSEVNRKWFMGSQLGIQAFRIGKAEVEGTQQFTNALLMGYGGYSFQPFVFPLYFKAWAGIGYTSAIDGETQLDGIPYDVAPITMFATLHVGYTFN